MESQATSSGFVAFESLNERRGRRETSESGGQQSLWRKSQLMKAKNHMRKFFASSLRPLAGDLAPRSNRNNSHASPTTDSGSSDPGEIGQLLRRRPIRGPLHMKVVDLLFALEFEDPIVEGEYKVYMHTNRMLPIVGCAALLVLFCIIVFDTGTRTFEDIIFFVVSASLWVVAILGMYFLKRRAALLTAELESEGQADVEAVDDVEEEVRAQLLGEISSFSSHSKRDAIRSNASLHEIFVLIGFVAVLPALMLTFWVKKACFGYTDPEVISNLCNNNLLWDGWSLSIAPGTAWVFFTTPQKTLLMVVLLFSVFFGLRFAPFAPVSDLRSIMSLLILVFISILWSVAAAFVDDRRKRNEFVATVQLRMFVIQSSALRREMRRLRFSNLPGELPTGIADSVRGQVALRWWAPRSNGGGVAICFAIANFSSWATHRCPLEAAMVLERFVSAIDGSIAIFVAAVDSATEGSDNSSVEPGKQRGQRARDGMSLKNHRYLRGQLRGDEISIAVSNAFIAHNAAPPAGSPLASGRSHVTDERAVVFTTFRLVQQCLEYIKANNILEQPTTFGEQLCPTSDVELYKGNIISKRRMKIVHPNWNCDELSVVAGIDVGTCGATLSAETAGLVFHGDAVAGAASCARHIKKFPKLLADENVAICTTSRFIAPILQSDGDKAQSLNDIFDVSMYLDDDCSLHNSSHATSQTTTAAVGMNPLDPVLAFQSTHSDSNSNVTTVVSNEIGERNPLHGLIVAGGTMYGSGEPSRPLAPAPLTQGNRCRMAVLVQCIQSDAADFEITGSKWQSQVSDTFDVTAGDSASKGFNSLTSPTDASQAATVPTVSTVASAKPSVQERTALMFRCWPIPHSLFANDETESAFQAERMSSYDSRDIYYFAGVCLVVSVGCLVICRIYGLTSIQSDGPLRYFLLAALCSALIGPLSSITFHLTNHSETLQRLVFHVSVAAFVAMVLCGVFVAPPGNVFGNGRLEWMYTLQFVLVARPQWYSPPVMIIAEVLCATIFSVEIMIRFDNARAPDGKLSNVIWITSFLVWMYLMRLQFDKSFRKRFVTALRVQYLNEQLAENFEEISGIIANVAPKGVAEEMKRRVAGHAGIDKEQMSKVRFMMCRSTSFATITDDVEVLFVTVTPVNSTDPSLFFGRTCSLDKQLDLLLGAAAARITRVKNIPGDVLMFTVRSIGDFGESEVRAAELIKAVPSIFSLTLAHFPLSKGLVTSGPMVGALLGSSSVSFEYCGGAYSIGLLLMDEVVRHGSLVGTSRMLRRCSAGLGLPFPMDESCFPWEMADESKGVRAVIGSELCCKVRGCPPVGIRVILPGRVNANDDLVQIQRRSV